MFLLTQSRHFFRFLIDLYQSRAIILELTRQDFYSKYLGSYLGLLWAFVNPTITILIFWFVFQVGFKTQPVAEVPFILWLMAGMVPWFFLSDSITNATLAIIEKSYLVKKVVFRISVLPIVKILAALAIHIFFIIVLFVMFLGYGFNPRLHHLQVIYYLFAMIILVLGISWITCSVIIFLRDIGQIVGMVLQFGFWLTPIFWSFKILPEQYQPLIQLNPAYYIIEGYRDSLINEVWFWERAELTAYFWFITAVLFVLGATVFRRLRPHFADVL